MKTRNEWQFSEAALRVDLPRIVREAESAVFPLPPVIRVTVDGSGAQVITLAHREAFEGFVRHGESTAVDRVLSCPRLPVDDTLKLASKDGERGVIAYVVDPEEPEGDAEWIAILGDHVGALSDRIEIKVEVF
jgi:hypothetical protein